VNLALPPPPPLNVVSHTTHPLSLLSLFFGFKGLSES
jgi:hypothetical protein